MTAIEIGTDLLGATGGIAALMALGATLARAPLPALATLRRAGPAVCASVLIVSLWTSVSPWAVGIAALGFIGGVHALALPAMRRRSLRGYARMRARRDEPGWWPQFEREFLELGRSNSSDVARSSANVADEESPEQRWVTRHRANLGLQITGRTRPVTVLASARSRIRAGRPAGEPGRTRSGAQVCERVWSRARGACLRKYG